jgi:hypothetical protein
MRATFWRSRRRSDWDLHPEMKLWCQECGPSGIRRQHPMAGSTDISTGARKVQVVSQRTYQISRSVERQRRRAVKRNPKIQQLSKVDDEKNNLVAEKCHSRQSHVVARKIAVTVSD